MLIAFICTLFLGWALASIIGSFAYFANDADSK